ncbi:MAG TPA: hypothetical protein PLL76_21760, partial [Thermoanaerobaculia bacterium]|nr:hypothetical protein [Thermoanaerobaculia bacterium]
KMPRSPRRTSLDVAKAVSELCGGKLDAIVVSHRHGDHISGFAGKAGTLLAQLKPDLVLQPWTEDPEVAPDATSPPSPAIGTKGRATVQAIARMPAITKNALTEAIRLGVSQTVREQLEFLGETGINNPAAVRNLLDLPCKHIYAYCGSTSGLQQVLPGVKVQVLGPPTLRQSEAIAEQRKEDPDEFWHLQHRAGVHAAAKKRLFPGAKTARRSALPFETRWFLPRLERVRGEQLLQIVRILDEKLNNTSLVLLFEVGKAKLLFPGDAQIENWQYALSKAHPGSSLHSLLADVSVYKVGHHGSLNATPKTLWNMFKRKAPTPPPDRLKTVLSTLAGKHGRAQRGTEVPREKLVAALKAESDFFTTQSLAKAPYRSLCIPV